MIRNYEQWQQRMLRERKELLERIDKLTHFLLTAHHYNVDEDEVDLLRLQLTHMKKYCEVLSNRIMRWYK